MIAFLINFNIAFKGSPDIGGLFLFVPLQEFQIKVVFLEKSFRERRILTLMTKKETYMLLATIKSLLGQKVLT